MSTTILKQRAKQTKLFVTVYILKKRIMIKMHMYLSKLQLNFVVVVSLVEADQILLVWSTNDDIWVTKY